MEPKHMTDTDTDTIPTARQLARQRHAAASCWRSSLEQQEHRLQGHLLRLQAEIDSVRLELAQARRAEAEADALLVRL